MWQLELEEVTVETCMGKSFDIIIRHQLDPVWNQLVWNRYMSYTIVSIPFPPTQSSKTRQLVYDLKTLRTLL